MKRLSKHFIGLSFLSTLALATGFPEHYYEIKNAKEQKREFINILKPLIDSGNEKIMKERAFVKKFFTNAISTSFRLLDAKDLKKLLSISKRYRIKDIYDRDQYLKKVDTVPVALALVQGAIESGWGKSRFVREANNVFGHWTWGEKGIIPLQREEGKTHKIRIFDTLQKSVDAYLLNLNRHFAYKEFRKVRFEKAQEGKKITAHEAADTMINYSELREKYVQMLYRMMDEHRLLYYDENKNAKTAGL